MCNSIESKSTESILEIDSQEDCVDYFNNPTRFYQHNRNFGFYKNSNVPVEEEEDLLEWLYNVN
jgi:hypothetical protein